MGYGHGYSCLPDKDWSGFNPSPFSIRYFKKFDVELLGDSLVYIKTVEYRLISIIRRAAVALHLILKTMKRKEILKRIFFRKLLTLGREIEDGMAEYHEPVPIPCDLVNFEYKFLFAVARIQ